MLTVTPWSSFWERNYFADALPVLRALADTAAARGAVTGIGLLTVAAGLVELAGLFRRANGPADQEDAERTGR